MKGEMKNEFVDVEIDEDIGEEEQIIVCEEASDEQEFTEIRKMFDEIDEKEPFSAPIEMYEEIEYLEAEPIEEQFSLDSNQTFEILQEDTPLLFCSFCPSSAGYKHEILLKRHVWEVHHSGNDPLICSICNFVFNPEDTRDDVLARQVQKHELAHQNDKFHSCLICPEVFKTLRSLEDHRQRQHINTQSNKCKGCQSDFATFRALHLHLTGSFCKETHEKPFKCYICNESFSMGVTKKRHIQTNHQDKKGADCPLCLRCKIPSAVAFENHYKIHFAGEECWTLKRSQKFIFCIFLLEPRFCCSYCGRNFYESDRLHTHIRRVHLNTKLICNWCQRTFRDKSGIARHILGVHFNQRNHQCPMCSKAFTASYNLKEHLFSVHKNASKFYTCGSCSQNFLYRKQYERHRNNCDGTKNRRRR